MQKEKNIDEVIETAPQNQLIQNTLLKMNMKLDYYVNPACSVSGGSDSDTMLDLIERVRFGRPVTYVFFDTGIEYEATKRHLDDLEEKYGIKILRRDATVPVPKGCKDYGRPFLSKEVSEHIAALQRHNFDWVDDSFEVLCKKYPKCVSALRWLCNKKGDGSMHNIKNIAFLREFLFANPPQFKISDECCKGAKKDPGKHFNKEVETNIKILGLRQAEGGVRASAYTNCFSAPDKNGVANYRPLWFWSDADKLEYKNHYGLAYSDCYEVWGMKRTGCAGCPFGSRFEQELEIIQQYEPKLYNACQNIFGRSYEYTRAYREFKAQKKLEKALNGQVTFEEVVT